jgi:hypothetical protein
VTSSEYGAENVTATLVRKAVELRLRPRPPAIEVDPPPLPEGQYRAIVADPPWRYQQAGVTKADSRKFYPTLSVEEIAALPVEPLAAESAHLWL